MNKRPPNNFAIAGVQKNSLIDYPGKISCVVFLSGCNFTCPYCHNPELAQGRYPQRISLDDFEAFLLPRRQLLDGVVISGGEPTLSPQLIDLCQLIRRAGLAIKLDTNGSRPRVLKKLIDSRLIDFIAMDIKTSLDRYGPPLAALPEQDHIIASIRLIMDSGLAYEFRTTCAPPFVDQEIIIRIARAIEGARQYMLQPFRPAGVLQPDFFAGAKPFSLEQMECLRAVAAPWVTHCVIR